MRDGHTHIFRDTIVLIVTDEIEGSLVPVVVPLKSVNRHGADDDYVDGSSGPGGGSCRQRLKSKCVKTTPEVMVQISWNLDHISKFYMKDTNDSSVSYMSTTVYHSTYVGTFDELLPQEPEEIDLVETLQNDSVCDMYVCALGKFHCDLYLATPSDDRRG